MCIELAQNVSRMRTRFIANVLNEIRGAEVEFRYALGGVNPADIASKGTNLGNLQAHQTWWTGTECLS